MNKAELIEVVAGRIDASKKDAAEAVQAVVDAIQEAVAKGQKVSISGFGVFERAARPARTYRKPSTGEAIRKVATSVPKFRPGGDFKAFVSGEKNISEAVKVAQAAGGDVIAAAGNAAGNVVESARSAVGRPSAKPAAAAKKAPAKKAPAKRAPKAAQPAPEAAPEAPVEAAAEAAAPAPAKKAPARKTTAKRAPAKKVAAAADGDAPAKAPVKRTRKKAVAAEPVAETPAEG